MGDSVIGTIASVAFGVLQAFLLKSVLLSFTRGRYEQAALALFLKLIFYAAAAAAVLFLPVNTIGCAVGCAAGLIITSLVWFVIISRQKAEKGDVGNENSNNN